MPLNEYRDEAGRFLQAVHASAEPVEHILAMLRQEMNLLQNTSAEDRGAFRHQVYDCLFLLFEIAAQQEMDLDLEWIDGRFRKAQKYGAPDPPQA